MVHGANKFCSNSTLNIFLTHRVSHQQSDFVNCEWHHNCKRKKCKKIAHCTVGHKCTVVHYCFFKKFAISIRFQFLVFAPDSTLSYLVIQRDSLLFFNRSSPFGRTSSIAIGIMSAIVWPFMLKCLPTGWSVFWFT